MYGENNSNKKLTTQDKNEMFKTMYKSAIKASYFHGFKDPQFAKKSIIQAQYIATEEERNVDEKTFKMMKGFKRPDQSFKVYNKRGNVLLESGGFMCFSKGKVYTAELNNTKFSIKNGEQTVRYADFNAVSAEVLEKGNKIYITFEGLSKENCIQFQPQNKHNNENKAWTDIIYKVIHESQGLQKHHTYLADHCPDFYKFEHILNSQFETKANTGDILLFRSTHNAARAQRMLLNSEYDHVGIVLRNSKNELFIYESTSDEGVGMTPWKHMVKYQWYSQLQKISWRPLNIQLANHQVQVIEAFVAKTLGKQFEITMNKLFQFTSKLERTVQDEEKKTYFCSELVARLYKELKLLDSEKSSTSYYPIDFSGKGALKFIRPGVRLGNQNIIAFQKA